MPKAISRSVAEQRRRWEKLQQAEEILVYGGSCHCLCKFTLKIGWD